MRGRASLAAALLVLAGGAAARADAGPRTASGVLGAETTLTWTGATAIRLAVPRATQYVDRDVELHVAGATYAFVRLMAPYAPGCPPQYGPRCVTDRVTWVKGVHDTPIYAGRAAGHRHDASFGMPAVVRPPYLLAYLITDGRATVTIRTTSLKGRTRYRPSARVHGRALRLPVNCVPAPCETAGDHANRVTYGGTAFDLAGAGWSEVWAVHLSDPAGATTDQVHTLATCLYPHHAHPEAAPDPARHPYGCDETGSPGSSASSAMAVASDHALSAPPSAGKARNVPWSGAHGRQYIGFQAVGAGPARAQVSAYGLWFRYLD